MKHLKQHIYEGLLTEAPQEYKRVVAGLYRFDADAENDEIVRQILDDFALKCAKLVEEFPDELIPDSLCMYDYFLNRYAIDNPGDVTAGPFATCIYSEIPEIVYKELINNHLDKKRSEEELRRLFGAGEFPIVKIWRGFHQGRKETHVTYYIIR